jgi:hypothetical protein
MAPDTFVIRFPNGDFEYAATPSPMPSVGDSIHRNGTVWRVTGVMHDGAPTVFVEHADEERREAS